MNEQLKTWLESDEAREEINESYFHGWRHSDLAVAEGWEADLIDNYGGEDQGSDYWAVWKFTHIESGEEMLVKFFGWYQSFVGSEYEGFKEVFAKEKTITVYE